jgi:hypothetical protein
MQFNRRSSSPSFMPPLSSRSSDMTAGTSPVPPPISLPFSVIPPRMMGERDGHPIEYKPYALVWGSTFFVTLDTPEKIGGLSVPIPMDIKHSTMRTEHVYDVLEEHDFGTHRRPVSVGKTDRLLGRVSCEVIVGCTPESIAECVKQKVLAAFRNSQDFLGGEPLDEPRELANPTIPA